MARDGKEALRLLRDPTVPVDIIISDPAMPEMDGIELLAQLHAAREDVSLIFLSASQSSLHADVDIAEAGGVHGLGVALHFARRQAPKLGVIGSGLQPSHRCSRSSASLQR
jgi:CheY-like chemotaxis protein